MTIVRFNERDPGTGGFTVYPAATYTMEVTDIEKGTSSKGNPQLKVSMAIKDKDGELHGKPYTEWIPMMDNTTWKVIDFLWACGIDNKAMPNIDTDSELFLRLCNLVKGRELGMSISIRVWDGQDRNQTDQYLRTEEEGIDVDMDELRGEIPSFLKQ